MTDVITKRRVTMRQGGHEAVDYVRPDFLDAYVEDARTRWESVTVSDEPDAGPGGFHGETVIPAHLDHPDAGMVYPATDAKG